MKKYIRIDVAKATLQIYIPKSNSDIEIKNSPDGLKKLYSKLKKENIKIILKELSFYKKVHKINREYQVWQDEIQPKLMQNDAMIKNKIDYIHDNPVKRICR